MPDDTKTVRLKLETHKRLRQLQLKLETGTQRVTMDDVIKHLLDLYKKEEEDE